MLRQIALTEPAAPEAPPKPAPFVLRLSPGVLLQIDARVLNEGVTMTVVIARALMAAGFSVPDDDLKDRKKRRYRLKNRRYLISQVSNTLNIKWLRMSR